MKVLVRWLIRRDMSKVMDIEKRSYNTPYSEENFLELLRRRNCVGLVITDKADCVLGYVIYELHKRHLTLHNFTIDPTLRRKKIGTALINRMKEKLNNQRRHSMSIEINDKNLDAQLFLKRLGFRAVDINRTNNSYLFNFDLRNQYQDPRFALKNRIKNYVPEPAFDVDPNVYEECYGYDDYDDYYDEDMF